MWLLLIGELSPLGDSHSSPEQKPDDGDDFASPIEDLGDDFDSPIEDLGDTLINNCENFDWLDLFDCMEFGRDLSAVSVLVTFFLAFGWFCLALNLLTMVAKNALASSFLVDG